MKQQKRASYGYFEDLRNRARNKINQGDWETALRLCTEAVAWARDHGERNDLDLAYCNEASILITQGQGAGMVGKMRQILLSSSKSEICYQAAYNISRFHEMRQESERGMFYARVCLDHAKTSRKPEAMARAYNQLGHLLVRDSYFVEARESYEQALGYLAGDPTLDRAIVLVNIGYCHVVAGDYAQGFSQLFTSLRIAKRFRADLWEMSPRLVLSYAYLDVDRPQRARGHARRGLLIAEEANIPWQIKNALYLLGESEKLCGDNFAAHRHFDRLQRDFYPDDPVVSDVLMTLDVRHLINLMA